MKAWKYKIGVLVMALGVRERVLRTKSDKEPCVKGKLSRAIQLTLFCQDVIKIESRVSSMLFLRPPNAVHIRERVG